MNWISSPNGEPPLTKASQGLARILRQPLRNSQSTPAEGTWIHHLVLAAVLLLAIFLHFFRLEQEGFANLYYAAAVKSMLASWHNFFFVSFDPGGFVSVDKPPLGLWVQAGSAWLLGFQVWSLLLPQALAGVLSVALLYHLVARIYGRTAGLTAALVLTLTPVSIAANRNNTMDSLLVLTSLLAAWAASLAAERGRLRWLLACALLIGIGFNIKMLQAYLVLPALFLIFLTAPLRWWQRFLHLAIAAILLGVVSLSWAIVVDRTHPDRRPYVGSSHNNTVMELVAGHNGAARLGMIAGWLGLPGGPRPLQPGGQPGRPSPPNNLPQPGPLPAGPGSPPQPGNPPGPILQDETGQPGILRLFNRSLAGQVSWLLPLAMLCIIPLAWQHKFQIPARPEQQALLLWSIWLIPQIAFFSFAGLFHRYYLEMLAPAVAALAGAGLVALRRDYDQHAWRGWLLPLALLGSALVESVILAPFPAWARWLTPLMGGLVLAAVSGLVILRLAERPGSLTINAPASGSFASLRAMFSGWFTALGLIALLIAPAAWAMIPVWHGGDTGLPFASPDLLNRPRSENSGLPHQDPLTDFLLRQHQGEKFILATLNARSAAPVILITGKPVMALGGFSGSDPILTVEQLAQRVAAGEVRFFLVPAPPQRPPNQPGPPLSPGGPPAPAAPGQPSPPGDQQPQSRLLRWVMQACHPLPPPLWGALEAPAGPPRPGNPANPGEQMLLFDCKRQ